MKFFKYVLIAAIFAFPMAKKASASYDTDRTIREETSIVLSTITVAANTSTSTILISLSSTSINGGVAGWPHNYNGEVHITGIEIQTDKLAASSSTVKLGVINFINQSTGSVTYFTESSNAKNGSNTASYTLLSMENCNFRCRANPITNTTGTTPYILSNDVLLGSSKYNKATNLPSPVGNWAPGFGDIVMDVTNFDATNSINIILRIAYHTHPR